MMNMLQARPNVASIKSRRIGDFTFDLTTTESHTSLLNITENPIETGASISDHAFLAPKEITINGIMVSHDPPVGTPMPSQGTPAQFDNIPSPGSFQALTPQALLTASRNFSVSSLVSSEVEKRALAPYLPNFNSAGSDASQTSERIRQAYSDLQSIQKSGELIEVMTGVALYKSMAIVSITLTQTSDESAEFTINLREVFIVETKKASGLNPSPNGRAGAQSAPVANKGKTQPDQSVIRRTTGIFG